MCRKAAAVIILFLGAVSMIAASNGYQLTMATASTSRASPGLRAQWIVIASSNATAQWWTESFVFVGNYTIPIGSKINLTITSVAGNRFRGDIEVGNLSLSDVPMSEISFNLLLGWYPFQPGLVCPVNWDVQKQNATTVGFKIRSSLIGVDPIVTFEYLQDGTGTLLIYDEISGLLLSGYGSLGGFMIAVALAYSNIAVGYPGTGYPMCGPYPVVLGGFMIVIIALAIIATVAAYRYPRIAAKKPGRER